VFGAVEALIKSTGSRFANLAEKAISERNLAMLRARLDEKTFTAAWQEGQQMEIEEVLEYALEGTDA
jgi:hypothetical protein